MALTALSTQTAGGTASAAGWANIVKANFDVLIAAWTAYTPTLTNVTLGTGGTVTGKYLQMGKTVFARVAVVLGTGGSFTGSIQVSLPVGGAVISEPLGSAFYYKSSTDTRYMGFVQSLNPATTAVFSSHGTAGPVGTTNPFTWGASDQLQCVLSYETS